MTDTAPWDAIVLAGGRSSRLGGIDKTALEFDGSTLLERALAAVAGARRVVVMGSAELRDRIPPRVRLATEQPRFGGPAAATAAGLAGLGADVAPRVAVIAADQPFAGEALAALFGLGRLAATADGVVAADSSGRQQPLLAIYDSRRLAEAVAAAGSLANASMRELTGSLVLCRVPLPDRLCTDIDTPAAAAALGVAVDRVPAHA